MSRPRRERRGARRDEKQTRHYTLVLSPIISDENMRKYWQEIHTCLVGSLHVWRGRGGSRREEIFEFALELRLLIRIIFKLYRKLHLLNHVLTPCELGFV